MISLRSCIPAYPYLVLPELDRGPGVVADRRVIGRRVNELVLPVAKADDRDAGAQVGMLISPRIDNPALLEPSSVIARAKNDQSGIAGRRRKHRTITRTA